MKRLYVILPYALITFFLGLMFFSISTLTAYRVGDGSEYYALYLAWVDTLSPWMSPASFASFQELVSRNEIVGLISADQLKAAFPALSVGETADFNHFWLYSFLAFALSAPLRFLGISIQVHQSFLLLHYALVLTVFLTFFRLYRWQGVASAVTMLLLSPMLWYLNKVHTELFTVVFALLSMAFVHRRLYLAAAACLAVASSQNPSFALIAFFPFFYRVALLRRSPFTAFEVILAIVTALLVLLHPIYYFFRYGVPTPQFLAGGASLGGNISTFYIWLLDPNLGLLPHWPLGVLAVVFGLFIFHQKRETRLNLKSRDSVFFIFFILSFFIVNFLAHSSTTNLNSGATVGPARYALWYLPAFFPIVLYVFNNFFITKILTFFWLVSLIFCGWFNVQANDLRKNESYDVPSRFSLFVQSNFSDLYSPPTEVFAERYSGVGERVHAFRPRAILGPDCTKVLLYPGYEGGKVFAPPSCQIDVVKFLQVLDSLVEGVPTSGPFYMQLNSEQIRHSKVRLKSGEHLVGLNRSGNFILGDGWSSPENFGVWSDRKIAKLTLPCDKNQFYYGQGALYLKLVLQPFGNQHLSVEYNNAVLYEGSLSTASEIEVELNIRGCKNRSMEVFFYIAEPRSPMELGQSNDPRRLGIALLKYSLK